MGNSKKNLNPSYVQNKLKQGWTLQDFCDDLDVSEEFLLNFVEKHSTNKVYANFPRQVKQNEQIAEKKRRSAEKKSNTENSTPTEVLETSETSPTLASTPESKVSNTPGISLPKENLDPTEVEIFNLQNRISEKEKDLLDKQKLKTQVSSEHDSLLLLTVRTQNNVDRLAKELELEKQKYHRLSSRLTVLANHMTSLDKEIENFETSIENIKSKIKELRKISVFVSSSGEITFNKKVAIPDSWKKLYPMLLEDSLVENLTVKQVQQLAKLIVIFEMLKEEEAYFEFVFEDGLKAGDNPLKTLFELFTEKNA